MYRTFIKQIASLQIILGYVILIPSIVAIIYGEWYSLLSFLASGTFVLGSGYLIYWAIGKPEEPKYKHSLAIAALGWIMIIVVGAIPYCVTAYITPFSVMQGFVPIGGDYASSLLYFKNPLHAIFESTSAFTTTGLTMAYHEPSVGKTVLFYRCLSQWVGGAGFIVMALAVFKQLPGQGAMLMYGSEASGTKLRATVIETARAIWKVYLVLTIIIIGYIFIGTALILPDYPISENLFDAVNHAMAAQSTGGFSTLDDSIAGYASAKMDALFILPMILGGLSIPFFYRFMFQGKVSELWNDIQTRAMLIACVVGSAGLSALLMHSGMVSDGVRVGVFQYVSALTTTGWQTSNIGAWDDLSILFIVAAAMIVGGSAGATVGGIKIIRALILQKGLQWHVAKVFLSANTIKAVKFNGETLLPDRMNRELANAGIFTLIYILFLFISTVITVALMSPDFTLADAIFEAASAQGTVGLSAGITDPSMSPILETVYIIQMWAGRLEIIPVLVLFRVLFFGTKPRIV